MKDLEEIPENVKRGLKIIPVGRLDEVLKHALVEELKPIAWPIVEAEAAPVTPPADAPVPEGDPGHITH